MKRELTVEALEERVRALEGEVRRREAWLSATLHSVGDAVIAVDVEGKVDRGSGGDSHRTRIMR